jgi:hypothetical protein
MTSATLFREGTDLDTLLAELDEQYDGQVHVVEVSHTREGGVLGFFARPKVAVHFTVSAPGDANRPAFPTPCPAGAAEADTLSEEVDESADPLDALIAAAEMVETGNATTLTGARARTAAQPEIDGVGNVEFARMLLDIAARKAAERGVELPAAAEIPAEQQAQAAPAQPAAPAVEPIQFEKLTPTVEGAKPKAVRVAKPKTATKSKAKTGTKTKAAAKAAKATDAADTVDVTKATDTATMSVTDAVTDAVTTAAPVIADAQAPEVRAAVKTEEKTKTEAKAATKTRARTARAATKTETAAAVQAKIAAVGESLRAELSIADLHEPDERLALRRRLSELGVPFDRIPTDAPHRYAAVEQLVHALPGVAPLPESDGQLVIVAGPSAQVAATAELLIKRMSLLPWQVWAYRCPGIAALPDREIRDAAHAATVAAHARQGAGEQKSQSTLVVIGLDEFETEQLRGGTTAASIIRALGPDAFWLHVDATRKASDTAALVRELGAPTALVVTGASRTASPASVWDLNVPVALLDGRPATASAWAVLLLDKLAEAAA